jgi:hypothetical protein
MTSEVQAAADEEDRLPWLEPVEEEESGPSPGKLIAAVLVGLVAIGIIVGGLFWLGNRASGGGGTEEVIASPGEYKVRPQEPGGMKVDDKGSTQVAASEGKEQTSSINQSAQPEAPVGQPQQNMQQPPARPATPPAQPAQPARPQAQPQQQAQQARLSGPTIQLGAFDSQDIANREWTRLSQRFPQQRGLQHAVMVYQTGGRTFYRLRAAGNDAPAACRRIQGARTPCTIISD